MATPFGWYDPDPAVRVWRPSDGRLIHDLGGYTLPIAALARVVRVFGAAHPHHAYLFANRRANRVKVLVHDGIGVWLAARRLNQGRFVWPKDTAVSVSLTRLQLDALVLGLPWQRVGEAGIIRVL